jgi:hypothetical protein
MKLLVIICAYHHRLWPLFLLCRRLRHHGCYCSLQSQSSFSWVWWQHVQSSFSYQCATLVEFLLGPFRCRSILLCLRWLSSRRHSCHWCHIDHIDLWYNRLTVSVFHTHTSQDDGLITCVTISKDIIGDYINQDDDQTVEGISYLVLEPARSHVPAQGMMTKLSRGFPLWSTSQPTTCVPTWCPYIGLCIHIGVAIHISSLHTCRIGAFMALAKDGAIPESRSHIFLHRLLQ